MAIRHEITAEEFEKLPKLGEGWLFDYNGKLMAKVKSSFDLVECFKNYDYPCPALLSELEEEIPKARERGYLEPSELWDIIRWKIYTLGPAAKETARRNFRKNTSREIRDKTRFLIKNLDAAETELDYHEFQESLKGTIKEMTSPESGNKIAGVKVRMLSAILRFVNSSRYGVLDVNAMNSLKSKFEFVIPSDSYTPESYVNYLKFITEFGKLYGLTPAETDMALYMHGRNRRGKRPKKCYGRCANIKSRFYCDSNRPT